MAQKDPEARPVEKAQLSAGVTLQSGHEVHLLVGGAKAGGAGADGTSSSPEEQSGEGGGSSDGDATTEGPSGQ